jgi:hypothetical protein
MDSQGLRIGIDDSTWRAEDNDYATHYTLTYIR